MLLEINNPKPVPLYDFEANFLNNLGNISGSIPVPVSLAIYLPTYRTGPVIQPYDGSI
jgi:hypothetical protein